MLYLSGLLLLLLDLSVICGAQNDTRSAFKGQDNSTGTHNVTHKNNDDVQKRFIYCDEMLLKLYCEVYCWEAFNDSMSAIAEEKWCNMEMVVSSYSKLTECMEKASNGLKCYYPNPVVEQLFVSIHQEYFSSCNNEEDLSDAPPGVVLVTTLLPILLIPFIVYIVVWKSSLKD